MVSPPRITKSQEYLQRKQTFLGSSNGCRSTSYPHNFSKRHILLGSPEGQGVWRKINNGASFLHNLQTPHSFFPCNTGLFGTIQFQRFTGVSHHLIQHDEGLDACPFDGFSHSLHLNLDVVEFLGEVKYHIWFRNLFQTRLDVWTNVARFIQDEFSCGCDCN
jgi:hypothetical protein